MTLILTLLLGCAKAPLPPPPTADAAIPLSGEAVKLDAVDDHRYLHYAVGRSIDAPPAVVWELLTDVDGFTAWNSTLVSVEGDIASGGSVELVAKIAPRRTFEIDVSVFEAPTRMVWEDGNDSFRGVRTFTLTENASGGTDWTMKEAYTGKMLKMIAPKLPDFVPVFEQYGKDLEAAADARAANPE